VNTSRYIEAMATLHTAHRIKMREAAAMYDQCLDELLTKFTKVCMDAERELEEELNALTKNL
jgi:hypothetical protein